MSDANKIGDAKLAQRVIEAYASGLDALTSKECTELKIDTQHCAALQKALGKGAEGVVTEEESKDLAGAGFSDEFIKGLAGTDGKRALIERVKWLGDHAVKKWWRIDASTFHRENMWDELGGSGPAAVPLLIERLRDGDAQVRAHACQSLGNIRPAAVSAIPALIDKLKDIDDDVRERAAGGLAGIGRSAAPAVPALVVALGDKNADVVWNVIGALAMIGPAAAPAVPELIGMLNDEERVVYVRRRAALALGNIGKPAHHALPFLDDMHDRDPDPNCRKAAGEAVEKILKDVK